MRIIFSCIVLLASFTFNKLAAQTARPDPFFVTDRVVEYDYGRKIFKTVLPFDDPFTLKIVNLPASITNLEISFYEIRGNYRLFKKNDDAITEDEFIAMNKIKKYRLSRWTRSNDSTFAYIPIPFSLQPNAKYVFSMQNVVRRELTEDEKSNVKTIVTTDNDIADFLNSMARSYTGTKKSFSKISGEAATLKSLVRTALGKADSSFTYDPPPQTDDELESALTQFVLGVKGYYDKLEEMEKSFPVDTTNIAKKAILTTKRLVSQSVNWWDAANDPAKANSIRDALNSIDTAQFTGTQKAKLADAKEALGDVVSTLTQVINDMVDNSIVVHVYKSTGMAPSYFVNMVDQANWYIGLDVGYAYIGNFSRFVTYSGLNIYFRPVNKNIPLSRYKTFGDIIATRASLLVGVTVGSIEKANVRKGIVGNSGVILGAGFRLNSWFRINGGALLYYRYDANPIMNNDRYSAKASPFISASIDIDVQQLIGALGTSIFKTTP